jgi:predicted NACHT family NTPase
MKPPAHVTGESGENYVIEIFNRMGWSASKPKDFGLDLFVETFDRATGVKGPVFAVQVKATVEPNIRGGCIVSPSIGPAEVADYLRVRIPVLFVMCHVQDAETSAWFTWVDEYLYGSLCLPFGEEVRQPVIFRIPLTNRLTEQSADDVRSYLNGWADTVKTAENISAFRQKQANAIRESSNVRHGVFNWDLFSLPISYRRRGTTASEPVSRPDQWLKQANRTVLLLGKPGSGKTITSNRLMADPTSDFLAVDVRPMLPATSEELRHRVRHQIGILGEPHFQHLESQRRLLILIDGLHEMSHSDDVAAMVSDLASEWSNTKFVVTCRTAHYERRVIDLRNFEEWEIMDLDAQSQDQFLLSQPDRVREAVQSAFARQPTLRTECANQFLFLIAAEVIPESEGRHLSRTELYQTFLFRYMKWMDVQEPEVMMGRLGAIAWRMRKSALDRTSILATQLSEWLREELGPTRSAALERRLYEQGLIEQVGDRSRFFQETLQEFLCAHHLVEKCVLPRQFEENNGGIRYEGVEINEMIKDFYVDLSCLYRVVPSLIKPTIS